MSRTFLTKRYPLRALHELNHSFGEDKRGLCGQLHGHEYLIEVVLEAPVNRDSGLLIAREHFDKTVREELLDRFDQTNLTKHFANTTGESLAAAFFNILERSAIGDQLSSLAIQETKKNRFVCRRKIS